MDPGGIVPSLHGHGERWIPAERVAPPLPECSGDGVAPAFPRRPAGGAAGVRPGLLQGSGGAVAAAVDPRLFLFIPKNFTECQLDTLQTLFAECPKNDPRQRPSLPMPICRVLFAMYSTRQTIFHVK